MKNRKKRVEGKKGVEANWWLKKEEALQIEQEALCTEKIMEALRIEEGALHIGLVFQCIFAWRCT